MNTPNADLDIARVPACGSDLSCLEQCRPDRCRPSCSLLVLGELLGTPGAVSADEADYLLDLHQLITQRRDAEQSIKVFCELRRRLEQKHYLAMYRLRHWLQNNVVVQVSSLINEQTVSVPLQLKFYCLEAVRRACLCSAMGRLGGLSCLRLRFEFLPLGLAVVRPAGSQSMPARQTIVTTT